MFKCDIIITNLKKMNISKIFTVLGFILLFGFVGILSIVCLPLLPKELTGEFPAFFVAVIFGLAGVGLIYLGSKGFPIGR